MATATRAVLAHFNVSELKNQLTVLTSTPGGASFVNRQAESRATDTLLQNNDIATNTFYVDLPLRLTIRVQSTNYLYEIWDEDGNFYQNTTRNNVAMQDFFLINGPSNKLLIPYKKYTIVTWTNVSSGIQDNFRIWNLIAFYSPQVTWWFSSEFSIWEGVNFGQYSFNQFGALTFTVSNYRTREDETIKLAVCKNAIASGTLTVTSSNTSFFNSYNQSFVIDNSILVSIKSKITGIFTGTIVISITGLGVEIQVPIIVSKY
jgi:hypothetical protein